MLQVPMAISRFPRKWKILARRLRMGSWSLAISMAWVRDKGKSKPSVWLFARTGMSSLSRAISPQSFHPSYPPSSSKFSHIMGPNTLGYNSLALNSQEPNSLLCSLPFSWTCPVNPSRPQVNPSCSHISMCAPSFFQGRWEEGPESASTSSKLIQCFYLGQSTCPIPSTVTDSFCLVYVAASETVNSCRAGAPSFHLCARQRVGSQGGAKAVC